MPRTEEGTMRRDTGTLLCAVGVLGVTAVILGGARTGDPAKAAVPVTLEQRIADLE